MDDVGVDGVGEDDVDCVNTNGVDADDDVLTIFAELETVILEAKAERFAKGTVTGFFTGILIPSKVNLRCFLLRRASSFLVLTDWRFGVLTADATSPGITSGISALAVIVFSSASFLKPDEDDNNPYRRRNSSKPSLTGQSCLEMATVSKTPVAFSWDSTVEASNMETLSLRWTALGPVKQPGFKGEGFTHRM